VVVVGTFCDLLPLNKEKGRLREAAVKEMGFYYGLNNLHYVEGSGATFENISSLQHVAFFAALQHPSMGKTISMSFKTAGVRLRLLRQRRSKFPVASLKEVTAAVGEDFSGSLTMTQILQPLSLWDTVFPLPLP